MKAFSLRYAEEFLRGSFASGLRRTLAFFGAAFLIVSSGTTYAANLSFEFRIPLEMSDCRDSYCFSSSEAQTSGIILIELNVAEPTEIEQQWGDEDVVSWSVSAGFPTLSSVAELPGEHSFGGTYSAMPGTGLTIGTLDFYEINNKDSLGNSRTKIYDNRWELRDPQGKIVMLPDQPQVAYAEVGQVPLPAAVWLFGSALVGLGVLKRPKA
ncbi:hypothetical protein EYC98_12260 [Halieaceae bacterium IMCC14734]|uniref:VPLPA-CTERM sorting domain-containing protein n=1 Tax=Candidatus Litorirhabdus singularis TaxID=2518993 RepID=A0ABT3TH82_9GAMM|nr:VPLPA-CTERM sorting domain-containing protein [Candidatus Litorirhabdus singularis]MCX2981636.1 hypothetical protein [Candidatus Litorirhabdus singularis]